MPSKKKVLERKSSLQASKAAMPYAAAGLTLAQLAEMTQCHLVGNPKYIVDGVADLESATERDASFFSNARYAEAMLRSKAGVVFVDEVAKREEGRNYLVSNNPSQAFQKWIDHLHPPRKSPSGFVGVHPTAVIHPTAVLEEGVTVGPHAVIDEEVRVGKGTFIGAGVYIGPSSTVGSDCILHPRVTVREECQIGNRVILQPGAVIGSCGFGYLTGKDGRHTKLNQVGSVILEDDVEIGANTTIDRARFKATRVSQGTKIDNLVQIGHGVIVGEHNIIVAQTGIAGSTTTGKWVVLAGQVAIAGHLHLSDGVTVAGKSGVTKSLAAGKYNGIPAIPVEEYNRKEVYLRNIKKYVLLLKKLAKLANVSVEE